MIPTSKIGGGQNARATGGPGILPGAMLSHRHFRYHRMHANPQRSQKSKVSDSTRFHRTHSSTRSSVLPWATLPLAAAIALAWFAPPLRAADDVTFASLLGEMVDRTVVTHPPTYPYRSLQASSYDRASVTPSNPGGWFANGDNNQVIRYETNQGRTEAVMMEHSGPGVITSIWTPFFYFDFNNRVGTDVRFYIDGETTPRLTTKLINLVRGAGPVSAPFGQATARAGCLYLPIPFRQSIKITQETKAFYYHINYRAYAAGTTVESFQPAMLTTYQSLIQSTGAELVNPTPFTGGTAVAFNQAIAARQSALVELPAGPSAVRQLQFRLQAANLPQALRSTVLEMSFDDETTVWCPLGDFFSNVNGIDPYHMWEREVQADGTLICRWIMPYQTRANVRLHNLANEPVSVTMLARVSPWSWTPSTFHFHTHWWTDVPYAPRPVRDMNFVEVQGTGVHVGDTFIVLNPLWSWWGEGDEKIYVDRDLDAPAFPSHFGTGTEDYYGWAGGVVPTRADEFSAPFVANVRVGGQTRDWVGEPYTHGYNICSRSRSLDAIPFATRFKLDIEAYNMIGTPDAYLQYALVSHWYGAPGVIHNRPPLPGAAAAAVPQTEDVHAGTTVGTELIASDYRFPGVAAAALAVPISAHGATAPTLGFRNAGDTQPSYVARNPNGGAIAGFSNTSANFTGSGYLSSGNAGGQLAMETGTSFGVETWARIDSIDGFDFIWSNGEGGGSGSSGGLTGLGLFVQSGKFQVIGHGLGITASKAAVTLGAWTHLAVIRDGGATKLYVNGVLDTPAAANFSSTSGNPGGSLDIGGALNDGTVGSLRGQVAFLRYFTFTPGSFIPAGNLSLTAPMPPPVSPPTAFTAWIDTFTTLGPADRSAAADPDGDGVSNIGEFALKGNPANPGAKGLTTLATPDLTGPVGRELTLTLAVRAGARFSGSPSPSAIIDGVRYTIEGSLDLNAYAAGVTEAPLALAPSVTGLPELGDSGWEYHTFILQPSEGLPGRGFLRVQIDQP
jgi:hypothetical protein